MNKSSFLQSVVMAACLTWCAHLQASSTFQVEYPVYTAQEDAGAVLVAVVRGGDLTEPASVDYFTSDQTAIAGEDYEETTGTLSFSANDSVQTVSIPLVNDGTEEPDETFRFTLIRPSPGDSLGPLKGGTITLKDNDPGVQFARKFFWVHEVDGELTLTVERGNDVDLSAFTVEYTTSDLTATAGQDYTPITGTLEFAEGEMTRTITIPVTDDGELEPQERFEVTLSNSTGPGGVGGNNPATVLLYDTTGHEPVRFGPATVRRSPFGRSIRAPLHGRWGGNSADWFQLSEVEASQDLFDWKPKAWVASSTADLPWEFGSQFYDAGHFGYVNQKLFFRAHQSPLLAAWPPPSDDVFVQRHPIYDVVLGGVGFTQRWLNDPARRNRHGISDNSCFRVSIWYPASLRLGATPERVFSPALGDASLRGWDYPDSYPDIEVATYSFRDQPFQITLAIPPEPCPVVLYSHAWTGSARETWNLAEYLTTQGFVVIAPDHADAWETTLEDGTFTCGGNNEAAYPQISAPLFGDRVRDFEMILTALPEWNVSDPILEGHLDLDHMGAMGLHCGGAVAAELCRTVPACRAGIMSGFWDLSLTGADTVAEEGTGTPFLFIQPSNFPYRTLFSNPAQSGAWFQIADSNWWSLYTWAHWDNAALNRVEKDREVLATVKAYVESFFRYHLIDDSENTLWQGPSEDYPNVINYQPK